MLWKGGAKVEILLWWDAIKSVPFSREGFMAATGPGVRSLCVWSLALLEAMAVLHQQEQKCQCCSPVGLALGALRMCGAILQEQQCYLAVILCLNLRPNKSRGKTDPVHREGMCPFSRCLLHFHCHHRKVPGVTGQCKDPRGRRTEFWHCHLASVWPHAKHSDPMGCFSIWKQRGR